MCKGIPACGALLAITPDLPEDDLDWLEAMLTEDDEFGFVPSPPGGSEASSHDGVDLLDWFSKQLNSETMVAPNGVVLPTAPLAAGVAPTADMLPAAAAALACEPQLLDAPPVAMAPSNSFSSCCQAPADHHQQQHVVVVKRHKPAASSRPAQQPAEVTHSDRTEHVKQKRRESAQRSRARKNAYVKELENENAALKQQVLQLKSLVTQLQTLMAN